jgi:hypothetical protein
MDRRLRASTSVPNGTETTTSSLKRASLASLARTSFSLREYNFLEICSLLGFVPVSFDFWLLPKVRDALLACKPKVHSTVLPNVPRARNFEEPFYGKARLGDLLLCSVLSNANTPKPVTDRGVSSGRKANVARIVLMCVASAEPGASQFQAGYLIEISLTLAFGQEICSCVGDAPSLKSVGSPTRGFSESIYGGYDENCRRSKNIFGCLIFETAGSIWSGLKRVCSTVCAHVTIESTPDEFCK